MITRKYGRSGSETAALGFGGMRFENPSDIDGSAETVLHAFEKGIRYFDTAPGYCEDKSELIMGQAIPEMKKRGAPFTISTKSNKPDGDELRAQLETSLKRLNVDCIDYYNCWYVRTMEDWEGRKRRGAVDAILKAKEEGLIRHAVFSTHLAGPDIRTVIEEGYFEGVTLGYSVMNSAYRQEGIDAAAENGLGVIVMNPLGGGLITGSGDALDFLKVRDDQSMLESALHFLLNDQRISSFLVGFRNKADVDSAVAAVESFRPYTESEMEHVERSISSDFNSLCTSCRYCDVCPEDIQVWAFQECWNHLKLKGTAEGIADRLKWHWSASLSELERCTSCGACEAACTQKLPIIDRFAELESALKSL
ncbi:MAG: aldo/keto reductase [Spirochaetales bacterium]|nr:aldo/keto reductase [Spirochaetales bacterium]